MKRLFKGLSVIILLAALVGAGVLVKQNQETRRGATMAETSMSVLPDSLQIEKDKEFTLIIWANTGRVEDKMAGAEMGVKYDSKVMSYVSAEIQSGYTLLDEGSEGVGDRWFKMVAMGEEKSEAFPLLKVKFKSLVDGTDSVFVSPGAKMMITGQGATWTVAKAFSSKVVVGKGGAATALNCGWCGNSCIDVNPKMMCPQVMPPEGKACINQAGKCVIQEKKVAGEGQMCGGIAGIMCDNGLICKYRSVETDSSRVIKPDVSGICVKENEIKPTPTGVTGGSCGQRCTGTAGCGVGLSCMPIWWPCDVAIPDSALKKIIANTEIDKVAINEMLKVCPAVQKVLVSSGAVDTSGVTKEVVKMPPFYGVCRNTSCLSSSSCACTPTATPTLRLTSTPTPITTVNPTATPTVISSTGSGGVLKFKMSYAGVTTASTCANNWPLSVMVVSGSESKTYTDVKLTEVGNDNGKKIFSGELVLAGFGPKTNIAIFLKGPKHIQVKYGKDLQTEFYNQPGGTLVVDSNAGVTPTYDFTKYPLTAGDVFGENGVRDGTVDGRDFSYVKTEANKRLEGDNLVADLNGNCKLESQDLALLMLAMKDKQSQLY